MAGKKGIADEPRLLAEIKKSAAPLLSERPPGALTARELASAAGVGYDVVRRKLLQLRAEGTLREARLRVARGGYTIVYWMDSAGDAGRCLTCGGELEAVRPGKWQCARCG